MLWDDTTDIGCDYAVCGGNTVLVSCVYGPGGNYGGQSPFNETIRCFLDQYEPNREKYGGLPSCVST